MSRHKIHIEDLKVGKFLLTPTGYFDGLQDAIGRKTFRKEEIILEKGVSESPFKVEEQYFNQLQMTIRSRTYERKAAQKWRPSPKLIWLGIPALVCLLIGFFLFSKSGDTIDSELAQEKEAIREYLLLETNSDELTEHLLAMDETSDSLSTVRGETIPLKGITDNYIEEELLDDLSE